MLNNEVIAVHNKDYDGEINNPDTVKRISITRDQWDRNLVSMAIRAAYVFGLSFAAVDFLVTADRESYILEINSAPGLERFQRPTEGPAIDAIRIFLNEVVKNYKNLIYL